MTSAGCMRTSTRGSPWRQHRCLQGRTQLAALGRLERERENLRAAGRYLLETGRIETLSRVVWDLFLYWWIRGLMPEARGWMDAILATGIEVSDRTRGIALGFSAWVSLWQERGGLGPGPFEESVRLFRAIGDPGSEALALCSLALAYLGESPARSRRRGGGGTRRRSRSSRAGHRRSSPWRR